MVEVKFAEDGQIQLSALMIATIGNATYEAQVIAYQDTTICDEIQWLQDMSHLSEDDVLEAENNMAQIIKHKAQNPTTTTYDHQKHPNRRHFLQMAQIISTNTNEQEAITARLCKAYTDNVFFVWCLEDVISREEELGIDLTINQRRAVLAMCHARHDATIGMTWDSIDEAIKIVSK